MSPGPSFSTVFLLISILSYPRITTKAWFTFQILLLLSTIFLPANRLFCFLRGLDGNGRFENLIFWNILSIIFTLFPMTTPLTLFLACVGRFDCSVLRGNGTHSPDSLFNIPIERITPGYPDDPLFYNKLTTRIRN